MGLALVVVGAAAFTGERVNVKRRRLPLVLGGVKMDDLSRLVRGAVPTGVLLGRPLGLKTTVARHRFTRRVNGLTTRGGLCGACVKYK